MRPSITRREFVHSAAIAASAAACAPHALLHAAEAARPLHKMKISLTPGSIGVKASGRDLINLAREHGFDAVEPMPDFLARLSDEELAALKQEMKPVVFGAAGLPVDFRNDEEKFRTSLTALVPRAAALKRAGVDRIGTWLSPAHNTLSYVDNLKQHATRLREVAKVLRDHGMRLGLEYVGTPTLRRNRPHTFIHSMRQTKELIHEIGTGNVGFVLDSWHWWTAGESEADLLTLKASDIISGDLNDAPKGIPIDEQQDGKRELPAATGVIPVDVFLNALTKLGYDGPMRAEPFNKPLNDMEDKEACAAVIAAMRKALKRSA